MLGVERNTRPTRRRSGLLEDVMSELPMLYAVRRLQIAETLSYI